MSHYPYSTEYLPAAPVMEIRLGAPGMEPSSGFLEALVDTGADATIVPIAHLDKSKGLSTATMRCGTWIRVR